MTQRLTRSKTVGFDLKKPVALIEAVWLKFVTATCRLSASQGPCGESSLRCFASVAGCKRPRVIRALKAGFDFGRAGGRFLKVRVMAEHFRESFEAQRLIAHKVTVTKEAQRLIEYQATVPTLVPVLCLVNGGQS